MALDERVAMGINTDVGEMPTNLAMVLATNDSWTN